MHVLMVIPQFLPSLLMWGVVSLAEVVEVVRKVEGQMGEGPTEVLQGLSPAWGLVKVPNWLGPIVLRTMETSTLRLPPCHYLMAVGRHSGLEPIFWIFPAPPMPSPPASGSPQFSPGAPHIEPTCPGVPSHPLFPCHII